MHKLYLTLLLGWSISFSFAQSTSHSIQHDGLTRGYILYVPAIYDSTQQTPLVFNLHGYGSNNAQQEFYGDFRPIADTANFILVHPNGTFDPTSSRYWNVGFAPSNIDDVGFIEAVIDQLQTEYNIDTRRIYTTGMSNGGFMSYRLACETSRFAAIASVTGSMTTEINNNCNPDYHTPIMQIHGDADPTVDYNGDTAINSLGIDSIIQYWVNTNNLPASPQMDMFPDINTSDGAYAIRDLYTSTGTEADVELIKIIGGGHTWPGAAITIGVTCQDFSASQEIWRFFSQYQKPIQVNTEELEMNDLEVKIYPNPARDFIYMKTTAEFEYMEVFNLQGQKLIEAPFNNQLDLTTLNKGIYLLRLSGGGEAITQKIMKL